MCGLCLVVAALIVIVPLALGLPWLWLVQAHDPPREEEPPPAPSLEPTAWDRTRFKRWLDEPPPPP